jgi:hypothetical protein
MQQIMAIVLTKVDPITLMQGAVDWKYAWRFSFTSASSYDVTHLCTTSLWHLFESKPHWQALKVYLDGVSPFISEEDAGCAEDIQEVSHEQHSSDKNGIDYNTTPSTMQEQVKGDAKEAASIWHKMEEPICKKIFQEIPSILAAFWVGLVERWVCHG